MKIAQPEPGCLLFGGKAIGAYLGVNERQALGLAERGLIPFFRVGSTICANKNTLLGWIAAKEAEASKSI